VPLTSIAQLRALKAKQRRGEISAEQVQEFIDATPRTRTGRLDVPRDPAAVLKRDTDDKAAVVVGGLLIGTSVLANPVADRYNDVRRAYYGRKIRVAQADLDAARSATTSRAGDWRKVQQANPNMSRKAARRVVQRDTINADVKRASSRLQAVRAAAKGGLGFRSRVALGTVPALVGVPLAWYGGRNLFERKKLEKRANEFDYAAAGALTAPAAFHGLSYAAKPFVDKPNQRRIDADPDLKARQKEHRVASGVPKNAEKGHPAWKTYFRNYPTTLPGGKMHRVLSYTHGGKTGMAVGLGLAGLGAVGGSQAYRATQRTKDRLEKSSDGGVTRRNGDALMSRRRRSTLESLGYSVGGLGAAGAGTAITSAKWAPPETHLRTKETIDDAVRRTYANAATMGRGKPTLTARMLSSPVGRDLGNRYVRTANLARKYPGRSAALAFSLKGLGVAAGVRAFHRRNESTGASHDIAVRPTTAASTSTLAKAVDEPPRGTLRSLRPNQRETANAMIGAGSTGLALGFLGGGIPGTRSTRILPDVKQAQGLRKVPEIIRLARAGDFGARINAHSTVRDFKYHPETIPRSKAKKDVFMAERSRGKMGPETTIINHLKTGRKISNLAFGAGLGLIGAGTALRVHSNRRGQNKVVLAKAASKDRDAVMVGAGLTGAAGAYGAGHALYRQGRKWAEQTGRDLDAAGRYIPEMGERSVSRRRATGPVPDVKPAVRAGDVSTQMLRRYPTEAVVQAGRYHGAATQGRYFANVYGKVGRVLRAGVTPAALGVAAVGGANYYRRKTAVAKHGGSLRRIVTSSDVRKSSDVVRAEMYEYLRPIPDNGYIHLVRMPTDVVAQVASTRLMDRARAEESRQERRKGRLSPSARYTMGRQFLFSTTGRDLR